MKRKNFSTGTVWESKVGYSRAVRIGNHIEVSGSVSIKDGKVYAPGDPYRQAQRSMEIIKDSLEQVGAKLSDVIRTRIYATDIENQWEEIGRAHAEAFGEIRPATTIVEVNELIKPEYLLEIEATAIIST